jgi:hypothetical protein
LVDKRDGLLVGWALQERHYCSLYFQNDNFDYLTYVFNQTDTNYDDTFSPSLIDHSCLPNAVVTFSGKLLCVRALEKIENPSPDNVSKII